MDQEIVYTDHAEKRLEERFISKQDMENGIFNGEWQEAYGDKKKLVQRINGKEIEVILKPENNKIRVITFYWR